MTSFSSLRRLWFSSIGRWVLCLSTMSLCALGLMFLMSNGHEDADAPKLTGETVFAGREDLPLQVEDKIVGKFSYGAEVTRDFGERIEVRHNQRNGGQAVGIVRRSQVVRAKDAVDYFSEVVRREPGNSWGWVNLALTRQIRGENTEALKDMDEAVRLDPSSQIYMNRGKLKANQGDNLGAIDDYSEAIRLDPKNATAYYGRGNLKDRMGDYLGAIKDQDQAILLDPDYPAAYSVRGSCKFSLKDYVGAMLDFDEAIRLNPVGYVTYHNRGNAKGETGDELGAIQDYDEAVRINPSSAPTFRTRGKSKCNLKDYAGAIEDFNEAIRLEPNNSGAYHDRGFCKSEVEDLSGAISDYGEAIRLNPTYGFTYHNRGSVRLKMHDFAGAIKDFDEAIRLDPHRASTYCNRGWARCHVMDERHDFQDAAIALDDFNTALRIDPQYSWAYKGRGWLKHSQQYYAGAIEDYRLEMHFNPMLSVVGNDLAFLYATARDERIRDPDWALQESEQKLSYFQSNGHALSAKACVLALKGQFAEAISLEKQAMNDKSFASDIRMVGGSHSAARIAAWEKQELWLYP